MHNKYKGEEVVYQLVRKNGITNDAGRRVGEHVANGKVFDKMEVLTDGINHDAARQLEGGLIRGRLRDLGSDDVDGNVMAALEEARQANLNRGRAPDGWFLPDDVWDLIKDAPVDVITP